MSLPTRFIRDANRVPVTGGISTTDPNQVLPLEIDEATGRLLVSAVVSIGPSVLPTSIVNGQQAATAFATALPTQVLQEGVVIESLSTNTVSVFIGSSGVTTSGSTGGYELQPGASIGIAVDDTNTIFIICASGSPIVTWVGS